MTKKTKLSPKYFNSIEDWTYYNYVKQNASINMINPKYSNDVLIIKGIIYLLDDSDYTGFITSDSKTLVTSNSEYLKVLITKEAK